MPSQAFCRPLERLPLPVSLPGDVLPPNHDLFWLAYAVLYGCRAMACRPLSDRAFYLCFHNYFAALHQAVCFAGRWIAALFSTAICLSYARLSLNLYCKLAIM